MHAFSDVVKYQIQHFFGYYANTFDTELEALLHVLKRTRRVFYLGGEIGRLLELLPPECTVLVVSDHGAKRMHGGVCINDWLIREGWLTLKEPVGGAPRRLTMDMIDRIVIKPIMEAGLSNAALIASPITWTQFVAPG